MAFFDRVRISTTISYMSYFNALHVVNRRVDPRLRLQLYLNQYIKDREYRALATDISESGLSVQKLTEPIVPHASIIGIELELPGTSETIWAAAEARFDSVGRDFHVSGLRFRSM